MKKTFSLLVALALFVPVTAFAQAEAAAAATEGVAIATLLSRWLHIFGAIFMLGGTFYVRAVLLPSAVETLDDATHQKLRVSVMGRWRKILMVLITILLVSGLYNFMKALPDHDGQSAYHMLFGIKFLLAIVVFGLASMLAGRKSISVKLQENSKLWLGVLLALGAAIVMIAGYMKMM